MDGYISKPVDLQSLYEVLDRLVARPEVQEEEQQLFVESVPESISDVSESEADADADTSVEAEADQVVAQLSEADEDAIGADGSLEEASEIGSDDYVQSTDQMPESDDSEATSEGEAVGLLDSDAPVDEPASEAAVNASEADS
jgi:YesN/AraC family two-component response regulator